jgi:DNA-binding response OmpR family regulator
MIAGFDAGADDLHHEPVKPRCTVSKVKSNTRRNAAKMRIMVT